MIFRRSQANPFDRHDVLVDGFSFQAALSVMQHTSRMIFKRWFGGAWDRLLCVFGSWETKRQKASLHTPEELECFKNDAIENRAKHY